MRPALPLALLTLAACGTPQPVTVTPEWLAAYAPSFPKSEPVPVLGMLDSVPAVALYLARVRYNVGECSDRYEPPQEVAASGTACCTGYARFWASWAKQRGDEAYVVAAWRPGLAHAFAMFRPPGGGWMLGSNDEAWIGFDFGPEIEAASQAGAALLLGAKVYAVRVWDADGSPVTTQKGTRYAP